MSELVFDIPSRQDKKHKKCKVCFTQNGHQRHDQNPERHQRHRTNKQHESASDSINGHTNGNAAYINFIKQE